MKHQATHLVNCYGPQTHKTFEGALLAYLANEFPQLAGDRARVAVARGMIEMVHRYYPETTHLRQGQTVWPTIAKDETSSYGKKIEKTRLVSVILDLVRSDDAKERMEGKPLCDIKREAVARLLLQADQQGGCMTSAEIAILLKICPTTVSKYIRDYELEHGNLLPRRGSIHDIGPTLTHKKEICRLLFLEGKSVETTCRLTRHSPRSVSRYITNFKQVLLCHQKGLTREETAHATRIAKRVVDEYHELFKEYAVTNPRLDELLKAAHPPLKDPKPN
jgi:DNA-binding CsgD family transcriptional regulator